MNYDDVSKGLSEFNPVAVDTYIKYCKRIELEVDSKSKKPKNPWFKYKKEDDLISWFKKVAEDKLYIDGVHVTIQSTGISYDYIAFKNRMYSKYPDSVIDVQLVYDGDVFNFEKISGQVSYTHKISSPFNRDDKDIIGAYCVIKNKRGEFLTTLTRQEIDKHRRVAKTDMIWSYWFAEMALKTIIKKACKQHFADIYQNIETIDNENYDPEKVSGKISESQVIDLKALCEQYAFPVDETLDRLAQAWRLEKIEDMPSHWFNHAVEKINAKATEREMAHGQDVPDNGE